MLKQWPWLLSVAVQVFYLWAHPIFKMVFPLKHEWQHLSLSLNVCMYNWYKKYLCQTSRVDTGCHPLYRPRTYPMNLGMKLAHGLEILCFKCIPHFFDSSKSFVTTLGSFLECQKWDDCRKGLMEGSAQWKQSAEGTKNGFQLMIYQPESSLARSSGKGILTIWHKRSWEEEADLPAVME